MNGMNFLDMISRDVQKMGSKVSQLLAKKEKVKAGPKDVCDILDRALEKASGAIALSGCKVEKSLKKGFVIPEKQDALVNAFVDIIYDCLNAMDGNNGELCLAVFQHAGKMMVVIKDNATHDDSTADDHLIRARFKNGPDGLPLELMHTRSLFSQFGGAMGVSSDPQHGRLFTIAFKKHYSYMN
jgi:C4-dicarboxylate-specific signal transduction histidine kinase